MKCGNTSQKSENTIKGSDSVCLWIGMTSTEEVPFEFLFIYVMVRSKPNYNYVVRYIQNSKSDIYFTLIQDTSRHLHKCEFLYTYIYTVSRVKPYQHLSFETGKCWIVCWIIMYNWICIQCIKSENFSGKKTLRYHFFLLKQFLILSAITDAQRP